MGMTMYIIRRLLLMIPTIFGVTLISFLIMQLAPGDPLLSQHSSSQGERETSRDAYLVQKRALGLDKPVLLNFNAWRDYHRTAPIVAHYLGRPVDEITAELPALAAAAPGTVEAERREFLAALKIPDWHKRLEDTEHQPALAQTIADFVQVWCEDAGTSAVPAMVSLLDDPQAHDLATRRGAIRALNHLVSEPLVYSYSREPKEAETAAVTASWRLWWSRQMQPEQIAPERIAELRQAFAELIEAPSRMALMEGLEQFTRGDAPYFIERLLDDSASLAEQNIAAIVLRLYIGKPLATDVAVTADEATVAEVTEHWQLYYRLAHDRLTPPLATRLWNIVADTQYANMVWRLATFNFGPSALKTREPVSERIGRAVAVSAPLMLISEALIYLIAVPLGIFCAVRRGQWWDRFISFVLFMLYSVPTFVAAMIFLLIFCYGTYWTLFPMSGLHSEGADELSWGEWLLDYAWHAFLPVVCLSLFSLASTAMYARASMLEVVSADYIRTARAKGVPERRVIWHHALRNALIPLITLFADFLPAMLGGSVLVEVLFGIPGMGRLSSTSIEQKDYPTLMALVYIDAIVVLVSLLISDILYCVADPRITFGNATEAE
ncbi:MAG: ABC transporter permease subunit [Planctomycetaceae bacterium]|nr:ABC transporter permease subunit [Planctomycetaceae bacterium]